MFGAKRALGSGRVASDISVTETQLISRHADPRRRGCRYTDAASVSDQGKDEKGCPFAATVEMSSDMDKPYNWAYRSPPVSVTARGSGAFSQSSSGMSGGAGGRGQAGQGVQSCLMDIKSTVFLNTRSLPQPPPRQPPTSQKSPQSEDFEVSWSSRWGENQRKHFVSLKTILTLLPRLV